MSEPWLDDEAPAPMPLMTRRGCAGLTVALILVALALLYLRSVYLTLFNEP